MEEILRKIIQEELAKIFGSTQNRENVKLDRVLDVNEVSDMIGRSKSWISQNKDKLPPTVYENSMKYKLSDIQNWLAKKDKEQEKKDKVVEFNQANRKKGTGIIIKPAKKGRN